MTGSSFDIPDSVVEYIRDVFRACNLRLSTKVSHMPTTHETSLDMTMIESLSQHAAPKRVSSDWIVRLDTHYLGGGRHFGEWEIADVGLILVVRRGGAVRTRKVALLQSKRLYPDEQRPEEDTALDYMIGFARLMQGDDTELGALEDRTFSFGSESRYRALRVRNQQYMRIESYEQKYSVPVHYMLYNPLRVPWTRVIPVPAGAEEFTDDCELGTRILRSADLRSGLTHKDDGDSPTLEDLRQTNQWLLENFVADEFLGCREGHIAEGPDDPGLFRVFNRRSGPIAAALAITIDGPQ